MFSRKKWEGYFWDDGSVLYRLMCVWVTWMYPVIKTYQIVHLRSVHFMEVIRQREYKRLD